MVHETSVISTWEQKYVGILQPGWVMCTHLLVCVHQSGLSQEHFGRARIVGDVSPHKNAVIHSEHDESTDNLLKVVF